MSLGRFSVIGYDVGVFGGPGGVVAVLDFPPSVGVVLIFTFPDPPGFFQILSRTAESPPQGDLIHPHVVGVSTQGYGVMDLGGFWGSRCF